ncbi:MAG: hypothetical protein MJZ33_00985 [Paludibacteraceae bacterium]|nr:hypothetical protein [Paludibacteraceae bacterium]
MNLIGKWQIKYTEFSLGKLGAQKKTREEYLQSDDKEDFFMANSIFVFSDDGTMTTFYKLPEGINLDDMGDEERALLTDDKKYIRDEHQRTWKTEGGKNFINRTTKGEILGEKLSPWIEIQENEDGSITVTDVFAAITYERIAE